jgi:NAD(P)-dependent dehydrogenase (short-subunit alcohol dehydrogenase family)
MSSLLAGHLASHFLSSKGLLLLTGSSSVFDSKVPTYACSYGMAKSSVLALARTLFASGPNYHVTCILPGTLDTPQNRASMPYSETWIPLLALAE